ncbi:MAG: hypothetical protein PXY39_02130 [archaeon]|nr:hypothetical protein [archaeon]
MPEIKEVLQIERHSNDPVLDAKMKREREVSELQRLIARKAQFQDKSDLNAAIASRRTEIEKIDKKILDLEAENKLKLEELRQKKRQSLPHGDLLDSLVEDEEGLVYTCSEHPTRRIRDWYLHIMSFQLHPEIKENNPTYRRRMQESIERDKHEAKEKVEKEYAQREAEKAASFARQGLVKVA